MCYWIRKQRTTLLLIFFVCGLISVVVAKSKEDINFQKQSFFEDYEYEDYSLMSANVRWDVARAVEKKLGIRATGSGGGAMGTVRLTSLSFHCFHSVSLEKAREMMVEIMEMYQQGVNGDKALRPYLVEYPFPTNRIDITIFFSKPDGGDLPTDQICCVWMGSGKIHYRKNNPEKKLAPFVVLHDESYEEAEKIVKAHRQVLLENHAKQKIEETSSIAS